MYRPHVHDDSPYDTNEVVKELRDKTVAMEKRLHEVEKLCKNLSTERMEGNSTNPQHSSPLLPSHNDDEGDEHLSHAEETERTTCDNQTFVDQSTSCHEQSASHITPMIIATPGTNQRVVYSIK